MIYLGSDHGGFHLKEKIMKWLKAWGYQFEDMGNQIYDKDDDYPQFAIAVAKKVASEEKQGKAYPHPWRGRPKGILVCRSAVGMVIAANKVLGARVAACYSEQMARLSREHNDANVIALSADLSDELKIKKILKTWLETEFSGEERHKRRVQQIEEIQGKFV